MRPFFCGESGGKGERENRLPERENGTGIGTGSGNILEKARDAKWGAMSSPNQGRWREKGDTGGEAHKICVKIFEGNTSS